MPHPRAASRRIAISLTAALISTVSLFATASTNKTFPDAIASDPAKLGWIIARATGRNVAQLLSERIWSRLGAEQDAYFTVDSIGTPFAGGGLNTGLRDLARFGEMLRNDGQFNGQQIVPKAVVDDLRRGGDKQAFAQAGYDLLKGWSYRSMWWVTNKEGGAFMARGVHGQRIYVDPKAEMVIVRYASHPVASNSANDPVTLPAFDALAQHLSRLP